MSVRKKNGSWLMRLHVSKSCQTLSDGRRCEKIVKSAVAKALYEFETGTRACCSIRERVDEFISDRKAGFGPKTCNARTAAAHRRRLMRFDQAFHSNPIDAITREDVQNWMKRRLARPRRGGSVSRDTVNKDVEALKAFARWAQEYKYAPEVLPLLLTPRLQTPGKIAGKNWRPPKVMDINSLMDIIDAIKLLRRDIGLLFEGMLLFGLRPSEVADLRMLDLRMPRKGNDGNLEYRRLKTQSKGTRTVPSGSVFHRWCLECRDLANQYGRPLSGDAPLVICIPGRCRVQPGGWTTGNLDKAVARVCKRLGYAIRPYLIRHSIISWFISRSDVSGAAIQTYAGHAKETTKNIYNHRTAKDAKPALDAIESLFLARQRQRVEGKGALVSEFEAVGADGTGKKAVSGIRAIQGTDSAHLS